MYQNVCKSCGSIDLFTKEKGNQVGLYCADCGKWIKWLSKEELNAFNHAEDKEDFTDHLLNMGATKGYLQGIEDFLNWYMVNDITYFAEDATFVREYFDGHKFATECYSKDELINLFKKESTVYNKIKQS